MWFPRVRTGWRATEQASLEGYSSSPAPAGSPQRNTCPAGTHAPASSGVARRLLVTTRKPGGCDQGGGLAREQQVASCQVGRSCCGLGKSPGDGHQGSDGRCQAGSGRHQGSCGRPQGRFGGPQGGCGGHQAWCGCPMASCGDQQGRCGRHQARCAENQTRCLGQQGRRDDGLQATCDDGLQAREGGGRGGGIAATRC